MILPNHIPIAEEIFADFGFSAFIVSGQGILTCSDKSKFPFEAKPGSSLQEVFAAPSIDLLLEFQDKMEDCFSKYNLPLQLISASSTKKTTIECFINKTKDDPKGLIVFWKPTGSYNPAQLLSSFSYSSRTPLNGIIGMAGLLLESGLPAAEKRYAEIIRSAGEEMLSLFNKLLDLNRIRLGTLRLESNLCLLEDLIDGILKHSSLAARQKNLNFHLYISPKFPKAFETDSNAFSRILSLIIENALLHTRHGSVSVLLQIIQRNQGQDEMEIKVIDTGCGMDAETVTKIKNGNTPSRPQADSASFGGYGLKIACQFISKLNGSYEINSTLQKGTEFVVRLPMKAIGTDLVFPIITKPELKPRSLLFCSNEITKSYLADSLRASGFEVDQVKSASEVIAKISQSEKNPYILALIEKDNPEVSGLKLGRDISQCEGSIPYMILVTQKAAERDQEIAAACYQAVLSTSAIPTEIQDLLNESLQWDTKKSSTAPISSGQVSILVVEDTPLNQEILSSQLDILGYSCEIAENGPSALKKLESNPYSLILMDCQMPEMDGFEVTSRIRKNETGSARTPIIAATAFALAGDREKCLAAGMDDYLSKPIKTEELKRVLNKWLPAGSPSKDISPLSAAKPGRNIVREIDFARLRAAAGGVESGLTQVKTLFFKNSFETIKKLKNAISSRDSVLALRATHDIRGACQLCGFMMLGELANQLEKACNEQRWESFESTLEVIHEQLEETEKAVANLKIKDIQG
jgi:two-component system sensor histidine kinase/response regulator